MTYEEAISELETIKRVYANMRKGYKPCVEALQMAIDLLRQADTPQADKGKCPFDDPIPCEWVCPMAQTDCGWK